MLQKSGAIAMSDVAVELGLAPTANLSIDDGRVRGLAKKITPSTMISLSDLYGKTRLSYNVYQQVCPYYAWTNFSLGDPHFIYTKSFKIVITEPAGVVIKSVIGYDANNQVIFNMGYGYSSTHRAFNVLTKHIGAGGGVYLQLIDASSVGTPTNYAIVSRTYIASQTLGEVFTIHRIEVIDINDNVYPLDNHRNLSITGGVKKILSSNSYMFDKFWSSADIKAYHDVLIQPNN